MAPQAKTKKAVQKTPAKEAVSSAAKKRATPKASDLEVPVVGVDGKAKGKVGLPKEFFGTKAPPELIAQAVRVYLANQRKGSASTKTRGEVEGSTRKIYRQKGTGRARHGAVRAPIFVGGGIVFGPKPRDFSLSFPDKMKRRALAGTLSEQFHQGNVVVVDGFEKMDPKTKLMAKALDAVAGDGTKLLVVPKGGEIVIRAARNIEGVDILPASNLHAYAILTHKKIVFMKGALTVLPGMSGEKA